MNTGTTNRFEEALAAMSEAEFDAFWQEVQRESGNGPSAAAFIANFALTPSAHRSQVRYEGMGFDLFVTADDYNFAMAA